MWELMPEIVAQANIAQQVEGEPVCMTTDIYTNQTGLIDLNIPNGSSCSRMWAVSIRQHCHTSGSQRSVYSTWSVMSCKSGGSNLRSVPSSPAPSPLSRTSVADCLLTLACWLQYQEQWNGTYTGFSPKCDTPGDSISILYPLACCKGRNLTHRGGDLLFWLFK